MKSIDLLEVRKKTPGDPLVAEPTPDTTTQTPKAKSGISRGISQDIVSQNGTTKYSYDLFQGFVKNTEDSDDDEDGGATSSVIKKARDVSLNNFTNNTYLKNGDGEALIIRSAFSLPLISDSLHQYNNPWTGPVGKTLKQINILSALAQHFRAVSAPKVETEIENGLNARRNNTVPVKSYGSQMPVVGWAAGANKYKIQFADNESMKSAIEEASLSIAEAFKGTNLILAHNKFPIHWVNTEKRNDATSFSLTHWIRTPDMDYPRTGDVQSLERYVQTRQIQHYVFGYYDTAGILVNPHKPEQIFIGFNVGTIEPIVDFYGTGARSLRRISQVRPSKVLGAPDSSFKAFEAELQGSTLTQPYKQLPEKIRSAYKKPEKVEKLLEITKAVIGDTPSAQVNYPVVIDNISLEETGMSTNAIAADFMEVLHPLVLMKPKAATNNGLTNAAMTFLGSADLSKCKVFYPDAENAAMFDSLLIGTNNRFLMISSKAGDGCAPSLTGLGAAFETLTNNVNNRGFPDRIKNEFNTLIKNYPGYTQLLLFFNVLGRGASTLDIELALPKLAAPKKIAQELLALKELKGDKRNKVGTALADKLNSLDNGKFTEFCEVVLSCTNLVQVNTQHSSHEGGKLNYLSIDGFLATWPNKIFENIEFTYLGGTLKFKIGIGGKTYDSDYGDEGYGEFQSYDHKGEKEIIHRYTSYSKLAGVRVPGTKRLSSKRRADDMRWNDVIKELDLKLKQIYADSDSISEQKALATYYKLDQLYKVAIDFSNDYGFDPSTTIRQGRGKRKVGGITTPQLLKKVGELVE